MFSVVWSIVAWMFHPFGPFECFAQFLQYEKGQRDTTVVQTILHQLVEFEAFEYRGLQIANGGTEEPSTGVGLQRIDSRSVLGLER